MRLRDLSDGHAWSQFIELYFPLVFRCLRRNGLQDADAADVAQEVLRSVAAAMPGFTYDASRGSFRGWLLAVTRSRLVKWWHAKKRAGTQLGETELGDWAEREATEQERAAWEADFRQSLLDVALERVRPLVQPATWQAFWRTSIDGQPAEEAAASLQMSVGAVYVARSRVIAKLRTAMRELELEET
jgi:RNA polymerase sigma-70 factor (ECF subfamily)